MTAFRYIPAIDGLRALAVVAVIIFHTFPEILPGGYVGVDIFFVISGYLITKIIVTELEQNNFSFIRFYSKRIKRIFPALIVVLATVYLAGWFVMLADEFKQLGKHIAAGAGFIANWVYWLESGYFDELKELKPLLNLWSLGVEEQFYILWPCIILCLVKFRVNLLKALLIFSATSFFLNIFLVENYQSGTFFLPFTRFWELSVGGMLAVGGNESLRLEKWRSISPIIGLVAIFIPMFLLTSESLFPGWLALSPVIGAALLIGNHHSRLIQIILSNKLLVGIGLISYPLYLWHWPLLSFGRLIKGSALSWYESIILLLAAFIFSICTYFFLEKNLRKAGSKTVAILILLMCAIGFQGWNTYDREGLEFRLRKNIQIPEHQKRDFIKWENKDMLPTGSCSPGFIYPEAHVCAQTDWEKSSDIVVLGDSHAFSAFWGIADAYKENHVTKLVGQGGCLPFLHSDKFGAYQTCSQNIDHQLNWIASNSAIKTVFIFHRATALKSDSDKASFERLARKTFDFLVLNNKKVVYAYSLPEINFEPRLCVGELPLGRKNPVNSCDYPLAREEESQKNYRDSITSVLNEYPMISRYDPAHFLCPEGTCKVVIEDAIMFTDSNHLSESGSKAQGIDIKAQFPLN